MKLTMFAALLLQLMTMMTSVAVVQSRSHGDLKSNYYWLILPEEQVRITLLYMAFAILRIEVDRHTLLLHLYMQLCGLHKISLLLKNKAHNKS